LRERVYIIILLLSLVSLLKLEASQKTRPDGFTEMIQDVSTHMPIEKSGDYAVPNDDELRDWSSILILFRHRSLDSCKQLLAKYNYTLIQVKDTYSGDIYDVVKENYPIKRGWGTYIYNRHYSRRLYIHVNHPIDDPHALAVGAELFRKLEAEWLLIGGTSRRAVAGRLSADVGLVKHSVFQRWHEMLSNLTHVTLSLHSYAEGKYEYPINVTDIVLSNGRTSDEQWGISQLSLSFRDTMRSAGLNCGLAMYDSGYGRLAGGWNPQGVFSNDSVGFGHWFYIELSKNMREHPFLLSKFMSSVTHALELTGKKISQEVNRGFGLVSPRVIHVDSLHRLFFPSSSQDTYRIITVNTTGRKNDTINLRMGNWVDLLDSKKSLTAMKVFDTGSSPYANQFRQPGRAVARSVVSKIVEKSARILPAGMKLAKDDLPDSSADEDKRSPEPLQVHRIPLKPVLLETYSQQHAPQSASYRWEGFVPRKFKPGVQLFEVNDQQSGADDAGVFTQFLIPIISSSYQTGANSFIGVQMTSMLVNEIARLVTEYKVPENNVGLLAEKTDEGDYYLRIFPGSGSSGKPNPREK